MNGRDTASFGDDWLALREPADHAARCGRLVERLASWLGDRRFLDIVDLGAGTGSNLRWLAPRLDFDQRWLLVDRDRGLLDRAARTDAEGLRAGRRVRFEPCRADLLRLGPSAIAGRDLVTASALFDLVSVGWLGRLAERLQAERTAALFALTVDGRRYFLQASGEPSRDRQDEEAARLFNRHQARDKGLGDALGPEAARALPRVLAEAGLHVETAPSDWRLSAGDPASLPLARALLEDWRVAILETAESQCDWLDDWYERRSRALREGRIGLCVGHLDVLALPEARV